MIVSDFGLHQRPIIPEIQEYLEETISGLKSLDYIIEEIFNEEELSEALANDLPSSLSLTNKKYFISDIIKLSKKFFNLSLNQNIRIQLEIVKTDMCRLFHVDHNSQRLLCTYLGPGTQWLDHSNVLRDGLGKGCNDHIVKDFNKINNAKEFELILLRGTKSKIDPLGTVHRSPPIEKEFRTRVLLKIDEL